MKCSLCDKVKPLVKAHIIPRCFFEIEKFEKRSPAIVSSSENLSPLRSRIGIYDRNILCRNCEDKFQKCDDYACKHLLHGRRNGKLLRSSDGSEVAYVFPESKYALLRDFFLGVLLRADLSTHFFFQHVKLGAYRRRLIKHFVGGEPLSERDFSVFAFYYPELKNEPLLVPPDRMRVSGITFYHFHLGRMGYCIKVDRRPCPQYLEKIVLRERSPLTLIAKRCSGTELHRIVSDIVSNRRNEAYFAT